VPGTDIDESMTAVVADHLDLPAARDVYPSDTAHPGPMTDADFARATDWFAIYAFAGQRAEVSMGYADPASLTCATGDGCVSTPVTGGVLQAREGLGWHEVTDTGRDDEWVFTTRLVRGGFYVSVREQIFAPSMEAARAQRTLDEAAMVDLVTDPRMTFAHP
jgi:hypothetical protein